MPEYLSITKNAGKVAIKTDPIAIKNVVFNKTTRPLHLCPAVLVPCGYLCPVGIIQKIIGSGALPIFAPRQLLLHCSNKLHPCNDAKSAYDRHGRRKYRLRRSSYFLPVHPVHKSVIYNGFARLKRLCKKPNVRHS